MKTSRLSFLKSIPAIIVGLFAFPALPSSTGKTKVTRWGVELLDKPVEHVTISYRNLTVPGSHGVLQLNGHIHERIGNKIVKRNATKQEMEQAIEDNFDEMRAEGEQWESIQVKYL